MFVSLHFAIFLYLIYHYVLPTSLLLLVYPSLPHWLTFVFAAITACSLYIRVIKFLKTTRRYKICSKLCIFILYTLSGLFFILLLITIFQFVYAFVSNQSANITTAPVYTILSLIPSAVISLVTWMLKTEVFQFEFAKLHWEDEHTTNDTNDQRDISNSNTPQEEERTPLLAVEENSNGASEANANHDNAAGHQDYGATRDDDHNETNC